MFRSTCVAAAFVCCMGGMAPPVFAAYPAEQPIRLLIPAEAGGGTDFIARIIGPRLSTILGQTVVIENRSGASGTIAGNMVAKAKPDGYTLVLAQSTSIVAASHIYKNLTYDPLKDLAPVSLVALVPNLLVVNAHSKAKTVQGLMSLARSEPQALTYGSSGYGSPSHLAGKMFEKLANVSLLHVPYKGAGPASTALLGSQIDVMFAPISAVLPLVRSHQLQALGVTTATRLKTLPDIPTVAEAGLEGFDINSWFGLFAPADTPKEIVNRLNDAVVRTLQDPKVVAALKEQASEPVGNSVEDFVSFLQVENTKAISLIEGTSAQMQ